MSSKKGSSLKYFSQDSTGFTIQPKTVLIVSLIYIGIVVLLHIFSKVGGSDNKIQQNVKIQTPETTNTDGDQTL